MVTLVDQAPAADPATGAPTAAADQPAAGTTPPAPSSRFAANIGSNVSYTVLASVTMVFYLPYLIDKLGVGAYAVVPLANSVVVYGSILTEGLDVAVNRYLAIDLHRGDREAANRTFNTALVLVLGMLAVLAVVAVPVVWFFPHVFGVNAGLVASSRLVVLAMLATFALSVLGGVFDVSTFVMQRFDLRNLVRLSSLALRVGTVVLLFGLVPPQLWHVGLGFVLGAVVSIAGSLLLWRRLTPQLRISVRSARRATARQLVTFSVWSIVNRVGMLLFLTVDVLVAGAVLGSAQAGYYAALLLFPELLRSLIDAASTIVNPAIVGRYAVQDVEGLQRLALRSVKLCGLALAVPVGLIVGFGRPLLGLWLGPDFRHLDVLLLVLVGHLSVNLATMPLAYVINAYNAVRFQGLVTVALGVVNVALAVLFVAGFGWGLIGIAAATAIVLTVKNLVLGVSTMRLLGRPARALLFPLAIVGITASAVAGLAWATTRLVTVDGYLQLALAGTVVATLAGLGVLRLALTADERALVRRLAPTPVGALFSRMRLT